MRCCDFDSNLERDVRCHLAATRTGFLPSISAYQDVNGNPISFFDGQEYHSLQSDRARCVLSAGRAGSPTPYAPDGPRPPSQAVLDLGGLPPTAACRPGQLHGALVSGAADGWRAATGWGDRPYGSVSQCWSR
jgi:hypothetical protein